MPAAAPAPVATRRRRRCGRHRTTRWRCRPPRRRRSRAASTARPLCMAASPRASAAPATACTCGRTDRTASRRIMASPIRSASIRCSNIWSRSPAGGSRRSASPATAPRGSGRPALVQPLPRPSAAAGRSAALDRARPDLELPVRRLPLHQPAKELRSGRQQLHHDAGPMWTCRARPATAPAPAMSPWRRIRDPGTAGWA